MNFLDTYDITGGTSTPPQSQSQQSLNEEVNEVIGQLGRFWGGFRKQSEKALETARKDLGGVVTQAQKELSKLTADGAQSSASAESSEPSAENSEKGAAAEDDTTPGAEDASSSSTPKLADVPSPSTSTQTLFSRLQTALPPNLVSTVQNNVPKSLKNASENIDFAQLRANLSSEFQRVQGLTRTQAEEYVHRSEVLLREAMKEAGEVLRDAVKVVPPEEADTTPGFTWDGTEAWMLPSSMPRTSGDSKGKQREGSTSGRASFDAQRAVATRAEGLLKKLKHDTDVIKADPEAPGGVPDLYRNWKSVSSIQDDANTAEWDKKRSAALEDTTDGPALKATMDTVVPSVMTADTFWTRYFFRVWQIEQDEKKRKAVLQGTANNEEELFTWEDEDDETGHAQIHAAVTDKKSTSSKTPTDLASSQQTLPLPSHLKESTDPPSVPSSQAATPATASPRQSSEESYDLVSSGNASERKEVPRQREGAGDESGDSDWE